MDELAPLSKERSEVRQKQTRITFRVTAAEYADIADAAGRAGVSVGGYIRGRVLAATTTRSLRRVALDVQAVARLQGELNRVGSNIHQLLKLIRFGGTPAGDEILAAFTGYREVTAAILVTLREARR